MTSTVTATAVDAGPGPDALRADRVAGLVLGRGGVLLATWVLLGALAVVPLSLLHVWRPVVALPVLLVALAVAVRVAGAVPAPAVRRGGALAVVAVAVGCGLWAGLTSAEHVVLRRDAGSYALYGQHLARSGTTGVDVRVPALGGPAVLAVPEVTVGSPAFYEQGTGAETSVVPQFLPATPAWLSLGWWAGGWTGLLLVPAVALAAALLACGGLATRLVGPGWAALATAAVGLSQPVLHVGRSTYSEPLALLVGCAGLAVLVDATAAAVDEGATGRLAAPRTAALARRLAFLAGLLVGGVALVRVDGLRETALLVPVAGLLAVRRHGSAGPLAVGLGVSTVVAAVSALLLSRPYLGSIAGSLLPLAAGAVVLGLGSLVVVRLSRRRIALPEPVRRALPAVLAAGVVAVGVVLASRPLWQVVRQDPADPGSRVVAALQLRQGLPVDGGRTYAEHTVAWVSWWLGVPALLLALAAAAGLAARLGTIWREGRPLPSWCGPFLVGLGSTVLTLYRPGITPDHPWADRRLAPVVLPTVVLLACAALAWLSARLPAGLSGRSPAGLSGRSPAGVPGRLLPGSAGRWGRLSARLSERLSALSARLPPALRGRASGKAPGGGAGPLARAVVPVVGGVLLLGPVLWATAPVATERTELGEVAALRRACAAFGPSDTAVLVGSRAANEWPQVLRGVCGVPSLTIRSSPTRPVSQATLDRVVGGIAAAGRRPVLVTADGAQVLTAVGAKPRQVVDLGTTEDARLLTRRPAGGVPLDVDLWVAPVVSSAR